MCGYRLANGLESADNGRLCYCTQDKRTYGECGCCHGNPAVESDGKGNVFCLCCGGAVQVVGRSVTETIVRAAMTYERGSSLMTNDNWSAWYQDGRTDARKAAQTLTASERATWAATYRSVARHADREHRNNTWAYYLGAAEILESWVDGEGA